MISTLKFIFDKITLKRISLLLTIFILSIIIGLYIGHLLYIPPGKAIPPANTNDLLTFRKIFFTNYLVAIVIVFLGYFSGGFISVLIIAINGFSTGYFFNYLDIPKLGGLKGVMYKLIFHAPLELFALFLMGSIGLRGFDFVQSFIKNKDFTNYKIVISNQMIYQYFMGTILLLIAAYIESLVAKLAL